MCGDLQAARRGADRTPPPAAQGHRHGVPRADTGRPVQQGGPRHGALPVEVQAGHTGMRWAIVFYYALNVIHYKLGG